MELFGEVRKKNMQRVAPLAVRMRPRTLDEFAGQHHFLGPGKLLRRMLEADRLTSVIFYGPPGTGKTFWAERTANDLAALTAFGKVFDELDDTDKRDILAHENKPGLVRLCCFYPAYGYEDFLDSLGLAFLGACR